MALLYRAPAKLTTSLRVTGVRDDGFHLIDAEMVSVSHYDDVWIQPGGSGVRYVDAEGRPIDVGPIGADLVSRALRLAGREAAVTVVKRIPPGAGLGGGSTNAGAVLRWAGFDDAEAAAGIGADVAFCVAGTPARVAGIGDQLMPSDVASSSTLTLVTPAIHCSTPAVYAAWDQLGGPVGDHGNDLEPAALVVEPGLVEVRERVQEVTGRRPRLAGSGSTWFVEGSFADIGVVVDVLEAPPLVQEQPLPPLLVTI